jgi:hypothetical protein
MDAERDAHLLKDDWEGGLCSAGGYLAAVAGDKANKSSSTSWRDVATASDEEMAQCFPRLPVQCSREIQTLRTAHALMYSEWHRRLLAGFNMLFYGFGSKMSLLREFALSECTLGPIVEINGYVATTRLGKVLNEVTEDLIGEALCVYVCVCVCIYDEVCVCALGRC